MKKIITLLITLAVVVHFYGQIKYTAISANPANGDGGTMTLLNPWDPNWNNTEFWNIYSIKFMGYVDGVGLVFKVTKIDGSTFTKSQDWGYIWNGSEGVTNLSATLSSDHTYYYVYFQPPSNFYAGVHDSYRIVSRWYDDNGYAHYNCGGYIDIRNDSKPIVNSLSNCINAGSVTFSWSSISTFQGKYEYQRSTDPNFSGASTYSITGTSVTLNLSSYTGKTIYFRVRGRGGSSSEKGPWSEVASITFKPTVQIYSDENEYNFGETIHIYASGDYNSVDFSGHGIYSQSGSNAYAHADEVGQWTYTATAYSTGNVCQAQSSISIKVICPTPLASFTGPTNVTVGQTVTYTNTSQGGNLSYKWYVDGSQVSTSTNLTYTFNSAGNHTVKLRVENECGNYAYSDPLTVTVNPEPQPNIKVSISGNEISNNGNYNVGDINLGESKDIQVKISNDGNAELTNISVSENSPEAEITQQPASTVTQGSNTYMTIRVTPQTSGNNKTATITINSNDPDENPFTFTLNYNAVQPNRPPTVQLPDDITVTGGEPIDISPTVSDPDGDALSYSWTIDNYITPATSTDAEYHGTAEDVDNEVVAHITLTVDDGNGHQASDQMSITIEPNHKPPVGTGEITAPDLVCVALYGFPISANGWQGTADRGIWTASPENVVKFSNPLEMNTTFFVLNDNGDQITITFTPENDYGTGQPASKTITIDHNPADPRKIDNGNYTYKGTLIYGRLATALGTNQPTGPRSGQGLDDPNYNLWPKAGYDWDMSGLTDEPLVNYFQKHNLNYKDFDGIADGILDLTLSNYSKQKIQEVFEGKRDISTLTDYEAYYYKYLQTQDITQINKKSKTPYSIVVQPINSYVDGYNMGAVIMENNSKSGDLKLKSMAFLVRVPEGKTLEDVTLYFTDENLNPINPDLGTAWVDFTPFSSPFFIKNNYAIIYLNILDSAIIVSPYKILFNLAYKIKDTDSTKASSDNVPLDVAGGAVLTPDTIIDVSGSNDNGSLTQIQSTNSRNEIKIIPNPNHGNFKLIVPQNYLQSKVNIYNVQGRLVYSGKLKQQNKQISLDDAKTGVYFIEIINNNGNVIRKKFVIHN